MPGWIDDSVAFLLPEEDRSGQRVQGSPYPGFTFTVLHFPIMVEALGLSLPLLKSLISQANSSKIVVELTDSVSRQIVYQAAFNISDLRGTRKSEGYLYKDVKNRATPMDNFHGVLALRFSSPGAVPSPPLSCAVQYGQDFGSVGLVQMTGLLESPTSPSLPFSKQACPLVSLQYTVLDPESLKRLYRSKKQQIEMEKMKNKDLRRRANLEEEERGDLLFLPVIDSNESDCEKLQLLSKHVIENLEFDFLLLVEDDTFVNLDNVVQMLNRQTSHNLWWTDFTSIPWPKASQLPSLLVPKGPAMVLSRSLVEYISHNGPYLKTFPSLLSSLAIWFAGLDIQTLSNKHWSQRIPVNVTDIQGDRSKLAFQGVSPKLMRRVWASSISNSNSKQGVEENFG